MVFVMWWRKIKPRQNMWSMFSLRMDSNNINFLILDIVFVNWDLRFRLDKQVIWISLENRNTNFLLYFKGTVVCGSWEIVSRIWIYTYRFEIMGDSLWNCRKIRRRDFRKVYGYHSRKHMGKHKPRRKNVGFWLMRAELDVLQLCLPHSGFAALGVSFNKISKTEHGGS